MINIYKLLSILLFVHDHGGGIAAIRPFTKLGRGRFRVGSISARGAKRD